MDALEKTDSSNEADVFIQTDHDKKLSKNGREKWGFHQILEARPLQSQNSLTRRHTMQNGHNRRKLPVPTDTKILEPLTLDTVDHMRPRSETDSSKPRAKSVQQVRQLMSYEPPNTNEQSEKVDEDRSIVKSDAPIETLPPTGFTKTSTHQFLKRNQPQTASLKQMRGKYYPPDVRSGEATSASATHLFMGKAGTTGDAVRPRSNTDPLWTKNGSKTFATKPWSPVAFFKALESKSRLRFGSDPSSKRSAATSKESEPFVHQCASISLTSLSEKAAPRIQNLKRNMGDGSSPPTSTLLSPKTPVNYSNTKTVLVMGSAKCGKTHLIDMLQKTADQCTKFSEPSLNFVEIHYEKDDLWQSLAPAALVVVYGPDEYSLKVATECLGGIRRKRSTGVLLPVLLVAIGANCIEKDAETVVKQHHVSHLAISLGSAASIQLLYMNLLNLLGDEMNPMKAFKPITEPQRPKSETNSPLSFQKLMSLCPSIRSCFNGVKSQSCGNLSKPSIDASCDHCVKAQ